METTFDKRAQKGGQTRKFFYRLFSVLLVLSIIATTVLVANNLIAPVPVSNSKQFTSLPFFVTQKLRARDYFHAGYSLYEDGRMLAYYYFVVTEDGKIMVTQDQEELPDPIESKLSPPFFFMGTATHISNSDYEEYIGWLVEMGVNERTARNGLLHYELQRHSKANALYFLLILLPFWLGFFYSRKAYKDHKAAVNALATYGNPEAIKAALDEELPSGVPCGALTVTRSFIYSTTGRLLLLPVRNLVWGYITKVTHRTYGVPTGTTFNLSLCSSDGSTYMASMPEAQARQLLNLVGDNKACKGVLGFNAARQKLWQKDKKRFIEMWQNDELVPKVEASAVSAPPVYPAAPPAPPATPDAPVKTPNTQGPEF